MERFKLTPAEQGMFKTMSNELLIRGLRNLTLDTCRLDLSEREKFYARCYELEIKSRMIQKDKEGLSIINQKTLGD